MPPPPPEPEPTPEPPAPGPTTPPGRASTDSARSTGAAAAGNAAAASDTAAGRREARHAVRQEDGDPAANRRAAHLRRALARLRLDGHAVVARAAERPALARDSQGRARSHAVGQDDRSRDGPQR